MTNALCALVGLALGSAGRASAWTDAPLCAAQPPQFQQVSYFDPDALTCEPEESYEAQGPLWTAPISAEEARRALAAAVRLQDTSPADALLQLRQVERAMPRIQDRIALRRGELLLRLSRPEEACEAFRIASDSPERNVAAEGRIGLTRCLLEGHNRLGEAELDKLCKRYPRLHERHALRFALGRARESWNNIPAAVAIYRSLDLESPETHAAADARAALERLRANGIHVQAYTPQEIVERAERLVERGSIEAGRSAVADALALATLPLQLKGRVHLLAAKMARISGDWDGVRAEIAHALNCGIPIGETLRLMPRVTNAPETADAQAGMAKVKKLSGGRPIKRMKANQLRPVLDLALQYELHEVATEVLASIGPRSTLAPQARFEMALLASGVASDESVASVFEGLRDTWGMSIAASYHHARALERMGRLDEARAELRAVVEADDGSTRYYGTWAQARLTNFEQLANGTCPRDVSGNCIPDTGLQLPAAVSGGPAERNLAPMGLPAATTPRGLPLPAAGLQLPAAGAGAGGGVTSWLGPVGRPLLAAIYEDRRSEESARSARRENIVARLGALARVYGLAYPWIGRAADLAELERYDDAASEISEAYQAFTDARGGLRVHAGVEAVLTNAAPPRHAALGALRRERLALDGEGRFALADVADMLGEPGVAVRLRETRGEPRPRAYSEEVERAAAKYGVDPNLLFAVMTVESVYYRHIVSWAGAVGLMQIMPRTGMRIARALGVRDFDTLDLLDPRTNVEFAAWYLSSLITRFDGRLPLAVAAYNGGPHNVRLWLSGYPNSMPLDAFLERIPFTETHRYVRRVLTHYAAYRAQQGLPMPNLAVSLPKLQPDPIAF